MNAVAYLNGAYLPLEEASVSVLDRGFLFGDGVYEVVPVYRGCLFLLPQHLGRLERSLDGIRLPNPHTAAQWSGLLRELVRRNEAADQSLYLQVTRGTAPREHGFPSRQRPTVFAMSHPSSPPRHDPVAAITARDIRWDRCEIKAITLLPNVLLRQQALEAGAAEALLIRDGRLTEGAASNVFLVRDHEVVTPPKGDELLPGITRELVIDLLREDGLSCIERVVPKGELALADEIWITSSTREVVPVVRLDGTAVGNGVPGPVWQRVNALYQAYKAELKND